MNLLLQYYAAALITTILLYQVIKKYYSNKYLKRFRSQLRPGLQVQVKIFGDYFDAEIQNLHDGICFVWIDEFQGFNYYQPSCIFPYDYK